MMLFSQINLISMLVIIPILIGTLAGEDYILNGDDVKEKGKYPFMAYVWVDGFMCGGSILTKRHVLTAQHCLFDDGKELSATRTSVVVGELNIRDWVNKGGKQIDVLKFIKHEDYEKNRYGDIWNDIAILYLKE